MLRMLKCLQRSFSTAISTPIRVCVVGSGPAGFYTAEKILKAHGGVEVDIIDRLPTPFGLVRSGVAPDHQETKVVTNQFSRVAKNGRCSFLGNVSLGSSISLAELRGMYNAVVLAYGAESDRVLSIPGEELSGIYSAREFVWWYNGHPDFSNLSPDLKNTDTAVILGQGNVALDVARVLLRPLNELATTDIACHALTALQESNIRKVYLVGRRGPAQAACTAKELREILGIKGVNIHIQEADLHISPEEEEELKSSRIRRRVFDLLSKAATSTPNNLTSHQRDLHFVFLRRPDTFLEADDRSGHVAGVHFEKTIVRDTGSGKQIAVGTEQYEDLKCGLVLKAIGYKSIPVEGLPFEPLKGIVPNIGGRVLNNISDDCKEFEKGLYVCGWLKRGPTGIIATNHHCAEETVANVIEDIHRGVISSLASPPGMEGLLDLLANKKVSVVPFKAWEKVDAEEKTRGSLKNKPREKLTTWQELMRVTLG